ncbi:MAG: prepilin-type N-terminal cleavage/methylation domain-containing protein [Oscillospiraceae bacterium]|nr:prepilin-type N-terminal cleavage/methylation domain-containing protein [Oscillospiraceae bacterium]
MKKILKGFTLVELIVVMAILVILMAGIMNMFKPIRETYVDATLYESQRTVQNGVVQYVTESVRYATDLGVYSTTGSTATSDVVSAVNNFTKAYLKANGVSDTDIADTAKYTTTKDAIKKNAEVIIIDNSTAYSYNGENYTGRILRRKVDGTTAITSNAEVAGTSECRLALGSAYYGESDLDVILTIKLDKDGSDYYGNASEGIGINVASTTSYALRENFMEDSGTKLIKTAGLIQCRNLSDVGGLYDVDTAVTHDDSKPQSTGASGKIYIVYLNDKIDVVE